MSATTVGGEDGYVRGVLLGLRLQPQVRYVAFFQGHDNNSHLGDTILCY